jgi:hypothetical protein
MTRYYNSSRLPRKFISGSQHLLKIFRFTLFALIVIITGSCEKGILKMGADILPEGDFVSINSIDTLSAFSYTMYDDSVRSDNPSVSYLGQIFDPFFGTTTAEFVTQIRLGSEWDTTAIAIDSVKLYLHFLSTKGGTGDINHTIRISEISEQIYTDSVYYSNRKAALTGYVLPDILLQSGLRQDTINNVSLRLPVEFGNYLIRDTKKLFYSNTKPDFRAYFKGLYFQMLPSPDDPLLISLSLAPPTSLGNFYNYIVLFMHDASGVVKEFYLNLDAQNRNASYNRFLHDYNSATSGNKMIYRNTSFRDTLSYLQYLNGVYTKVTLPGLESLKNNAAFDKIGVNKARLIVPVYFNGNQYKPSTVPTQLVLRYKTSEGSKFVVPDWSIESTYHTFFDGKLDSTTNVYRFNIPAFVQAYLKDKTGNIKPELEIYQGAGTNNVVLKANKSKTPVKFEFTYTKF